MKFHVYFVMDGINGRESFFVADEGLDAYQSAFDQFHHYAREIGAVRIEGPRSAWDHIPIYHGPIAEYVIPA